MSATPVKRDVGSITDPVKMLAGSVKLPAPLDTETSGLALLGNVIGGRAPIEMPSTPATSVTIEALAWLVALMANTAANNKILSLRMLACSLPQPTLAGTYRSHPAALSPEKTEEPAGENASPVPSGPLAVESLKWLI
jgi:hypothetical protein